MSDEGLGAQPLFFCLTKKKRWSSFVIEDKIHILQMAVL